MEQFKALPPDQAYASAWRWLIGYFDGALEFKGSMTRPALRTLLDRMARFAGGGPYQPDEATALAQLAQPLDLGHQPLSPYPFSWQVLRGYLEAAYHYRPKGLTRADLLHVLEQMEERAHQPTT